MARMLQRFLPHTILIGILFLFFPSTVASVILSSTNYKNLLSAVSSGGGIRSSTSYVQEDTAGQSSFLGGATSANSIKP